MLGPVLATGAVSASAIAALLFSTTPTSLTFGSGIITIGPAATGRKAATQTVAVKAKAASSRRERVGLEDIFSKRVMRLSRSIWFPTSVAAHSYFRRLDFSPDLPATDTN